MKWTGSLRRLSILARSLPPVAGGRESLNVVLGLASQVRTSDFVNGGGKGGWSSIPSLDNHSPRQSVFDSDYGKGLFKGNKARRERTKPRELGIEQEVRQRIAWTR